MPKRKRNGIEGGFDRTGTQAKVESPGKYEIPPEEQVPSPEIYVDIEHGSSPRGLRTIGKKFLHIRSVLKRHNERKKAA